MCSQPICSTQATGCTAIISPSSKNSHRNSAVECASATQCSFSELEWSTSGEFDRIYQDGKTARTAREVGTPADTKGVGWQAPVDPLAGLGVVSHNNGEAGARVPFGSSRRVCGEVIVVGASGK